MDFICESMQEAESTVNSAISVFREFNLNINPSKTEYTIIQKERISPGLLQKTKKLGTILDTEAELVRRKSLSNIALYKLKYIWKNRFVKTPLKVLLYKTYVRPILTYNCGTWATTKTLDRRIDSFHRRQLRIAVNRSFPKEIPSENLYRITQQQKLSDFIKLRRRKALGHALRSENAANDVFSYILDRKLLFRKTIGRNNLLKCY